MWYEAYLIKEATLWSAMRPRLAQQLAKAQAKRVGMPVRPWSRSPDPEMRRWGARVPGATLTGRTIAPEARGIYYAPGTPFSKPTGLGEIVQHELSEVKYVPKNNPDKRRVVSVDPRTVPQIHKLLSAVSADPVKAMTRPTAAMRRAQSAALSGRVMHADPRVLLDESYRAASGQVSPAFAKLMFATRLRTGEIDALKRLGIAYGKSMIQPGGVAYAQALKRFKKFPGVMTKGPTGTVIYNLQPLSGIGTDAATKALEKRRAARAELVRQTPAIDPRERWQQQYAQQRLKNRGVFAPPKVTEETISMKEFNKLKRSGKV